MLVYLPPTSSYPSFQCVILYSCIVACPLDWRISYLIFFNISATRKVLRIKHWLTHLTTRRRLRRPPPGSRRAAWGRWSREPTPPCPSPRNNYTEGYPGSSPPPPRFIHEFLHMLQTRSHGRRNYKDTNPKCRLYWFFCLRWCSNFVGSESGQKQIVKLLQNMVYNTTQHPPPHSHTMSVYFGKGGGGVGEVRDKVDGQFTRGVENTNMTIVSPVYRLYYTSVKATFRVLYLYSSFVHTRSPFLRGIHTITGEGGGVR